MKEQEDIQEELRELRRLLSDYVETSLSNSQQRRAENIQILVALGILGGFITLYVQNIVQTSNLSVPFWLIAGSSGAFLLLKTLLPPISMELDSDHLSTFDARLSLFLYVFSIIASIMVGGVILAPIPSIPLPNLPSFKDGPLIALPIVASFILAYGYARLAGTTVEKQAAKVSDLQGRISEMREKDIVMRIADFPELLSDFVGEDIESVEVERVIGDRARPDLFARNESGDPLIIEVVVQRASVSKREKVLQVQRYIEEYKKSSPNEEEPKGFLILIDESGIEVAKISDDGLVEMGYNFKKEDFEDLR